MTPTLEERAAELASSGLCNLAWSGARDAILEALCCVADAAAEEMRKRCAEHLDALADRVPGHNQANYYYRHAAVVIRDLPLSPPKE